MKKAFTLLEVVVVLALLAALTHLAVRELSHLRDSKLTKTADAQLLEIKDAVFKGALSGEGSGFLADMGRLPRVVNGTLSELWSMPAGSRTYAVREAVGANLVSGVPDTPGVYVPTGWRGEYLKLPYAKTRLFDPWGNAVEVEDSAGLARLWESNGFIVAAAHYGPKAARSGERKISLLPQLGASSRLFISTRSISTAKDGALQYRWYGPSDGFITGAVVNATCPGTAIAEGLTPGVRMLWDSVTRSSRLIEVKPGDNILSVELP